jgi:hypothetical protein
MDKFIPEKFARTMLKEMAQIRTIVGSLHDIHTNLLHLKSGYSARQKKAADKKLMARLAREQSVIYASLLRRSGLTGSKALAPR